MTLTEIANLGIITFCICGIAGTANYVWATRRMVLMEERKADAQIKAFENAEPKRQDGVHSSDINPLR